MPSPIKDLLSSIRRWEVRNQSACHCFSAFLSAACDPKVSLWHFQRVWGGNSFYNNNTLYTVWAFIRKGKAASFFLHTRRAAPNWALPHTLYCHSARGKGTSFTSVLMMGLERWLSGEEHVLLLWIWVQLSAPHGTVDCSSRGSLAFRPPHICTQEHISTYRHTAHTFFFLEKMSWNVNCIDFY